MAKMPEIKVKLEISEEILNKALKEAGGSSLEKIDSTGSEMKPISCLGKVKALKEHREAVVCVDNSWWWD